MTDPVRQVAFHVLRAVAERDAYVNLVLPAMLTEHQITGATRPSPPSSCTARFAGRALRRGD